MEQMKLQSPLFDKIFLTKSLFIAQLDPIEIILDNLMNFDNCTILFLMILIRFNKKILNRFKGFLTRFWGVLTNISVFFPILHNGWFPRFESNKYLNSHTSLIRHPQGPQGCQKIHKMILQINLIS